MSNYNLGISRANDKKTTMHLWTELDGGRGSNEISSCLWKFVETKYSRTQNPRRLVVWFDRCIGQNNKKIVLATLIKLVRASFFSSVEQKFFVTGHSFNVCDRNFGILEAKMRKTTLLTPSDIVNLVEDAAQDNPFTAQRISQNDILHFKDLSGHIKFPNNFHVTHHLRYQYSMELPENLGTWTSHCPTEPMHLIVLGIGIQFSQLPQPQNTRPLIMDRNKLADLRKLAEFLFAEPLAFYTALFEEQRELREDQENESV